MGAKHAAVKRSNKCQAQENKNLFVLYIIYNMKIYVNLVQAASVFEKPKIEIEISKLFQLFLNKNNKNKRKY